MNSHTLLPTLALALCVAVLCSFVNLENSATPPSTTSKILVAYYNVIEPQSVDATTGASPQSANYRKPMTTKDVASVISKATNAELFEIKAATSNSSSSRNPSDKTTRPALVNHIQNLQDYNVIFVGFPSKAQDDLQPLYAFFDEYDFTGKTIVPFCTNGSNHFKDIVATIQGMEKHATFLEGYTTGRYRVNKKEINLWLKNIGMTK